MEVINSCSTSNGGCEQFCQQGETGMICLCHLGYRLQSDAKSCEGMSAKISSFRFHVIVLHSCFFICSEIKEEK